MLMLHYEAHIASSVGNNKNRIKTFGVRFGGDLDINTGCVLANNSTETEVTY